MLLLNQTLSEAEKHGILASAERYGDQRLGEARGREMPCIPLLGL